MHKMDDIKLLLFMFATLFVFAVLSYWQSASGAARNENSQSVTQFVEVQP